jgi:hypothetical protein
LFTANKVEGEGEFEAPLIFILKFLKILFTFFFPYAIKYLIVQKKELKFL